MGNIFSTGDHYPPLPGSPNFTLCAVFCGLHLVQAVVMQGQQRWGSCFFVPRALMPSRHDYYQSIPAGRDTDCAICMGELGLTGMHVVAPCKHSFHLVCLEKWMEVKMECPTCRAA